MKTWGYRICLSVFSILFCLAAKGQSADSASFKVAVEDKAAPMEETLQGAPFNPIRRDSFLSGFGLPGPYGSRVSTYISNHPSVRTDLKPVGLPHQPRKVRNTDWVFYLFAGSLFLLGLTRVVFPGYLEDMLREYFGTSMTQWTKGEGVARHGVASLWLNLLFLFNGAVFLHFLLRSDDPGALSWKPWQWIGFWAVLLAAVYLFKYAFLLLAGWVFGLVRQAHDYMSIVFEVNRLSAILLLVCALLLALSRDVGPGIFLPLVWLVLAVLLALRLVRAYGFFRKSQGLGPIQFLAFFLSFEVLPILLLRKAFDDLFL